MSGQPTPGTRWGGFQIVEELGSGGSGRVFRAHDPTLGRPVALKVLDAAAGPVAVDRFLLENRIVARLGHPRIVPVHRTGDVDGVPFVVMDLVDGGDLAGALRAGPLPLDRTATVVTQLAGALDRAHRAGVVHAGLTPADVLTTADGDVLLTGFGAPAGPDRPNHCAPEQLRGRSPGPETDVYALGCLLFECLTGRVPFPAGTPEGVARQHLEAPRPAVTDLRPDLPEALDGIVAEAMAREPTDRQPTARAVADGLRSVVATVEPTAAEPALAPTRADLVAASAPAGGRSSVFEPAPPDDTAALPPVGPGAGGRRRVLDGAAFGVYEDDLPESRAPAIVGALLAVALLVVGVLVWRAVNTGAELDVPTETAGSPDTTTGGDDGPTVEDLELLIPPELDSCAAPDEQPADEPRRVLVQCETDGAPGDVSFFLYGSVEDRDAAFDYVAAVALGLPDAGGECALGQAAHHDYLGVEQVGRVACRRAEDRTDFVWTSDAAPLLMSAGGGGSFADHYDAWSSLVDRTDASFPLGVEQVLLDQLPEELLDGCRRDLELLVEASAEVAATCEPERTPPGRVSWIQFGAEETMAAWIEARSAELTGRASGDDDGACPEGSTRYELDGTTGRVLCSLSGDGSNVVVWTRDGSLVGSVAVSDRSSGQSMADLLRWWENGGYRP